MSAICDWFRHCLDGARIRKRERERVALVRDAALVLQAMEFDGKLYVCFNGVPLVEARMLVMDIPDALAEMRGAYVKHVEAYKQLK